MAVARLHLPFRPIKFWLFSHLLVYMGDLALFEIFFFLFNGENSRKDEIAKMQTRLPLSNLLS